MKFVRILSVCLMCGMAPASLAAGPGEQDAVMIRGMPAVPITDTMPGTVWGFTSAMSPALPVMGRLFPPNLIMQRQQTLGLTDRQTEAIKAEMRSFQSGVVDVQWDLQASQAELQGLLAQNTIDADAAGAAIDRVLAAENALKKLHLTLLIRIRNTLDDTQISKLETAMPPHFSGWNVMLPEVPEAPPAP